MSESLKQLSGVIAVEIPGYDGLSYLRGPRREQIPTGAELLERLSEELLHEQGVNPEGYREHQLGRLANSLQSIVEICSSAD